MVSPVICNYCGKEITGEPIVYRPALRFSFGNFQFNF
ncbi:TRASH domain-containing protein [Thermococcus pacificus]